MIKPAARNLRFPLVTTTVTNTVSVLMTLDPVVHAEAMAAEFESYLN